MDSLLSTVPGGRLFRATLTTGAVAILAGVGSCGDPSTTVTPPPPPPTPPTLTISPSHITLVRGTVARPSLRMGSEVVNGSWWIDDTEVGSVSLSGEVLGLRVGQSTIKAAVGGDTVTATIEVTPAQWSARTVPAVPGAVGYGAGALAECDRGDLQVHRVTSLQDDGAGTLRASLGAASHSGLDVIVFDVAGLITLTSPLALSNVSCVYIAGQTAPGSGVTVRAPGLTALIFRNTVRDVVMRFLRMRGGYGGDRLGSINILVASGHDILLDHLSLSWTTDKLLALSKFNQPWSQPISHVTVQRSIISEVFAYHPTAVQISAEDRLDPPVRDIDMHHNLFAHNSHRNPNNITNGFKFVNNVVYNWNQAASQGSERSVADWIGNSYLRGPISNEFDWEVTYTCNDDAASYYVVGNVGPHNQDEGADNWSGSSRMVACYYFTGEYVGEPLPESYRRTVPLPDAERFPIEPQSAAGSFASVLNDSGANARLACDGSWLSAIDAVDQRILTDVQQGSGPDHVIASELEVGGYPDLVPGELCPDLDRDGMPDAFEDRYGLAPNDPADAAYDPDHDGYTNLEEYLNATVPWPHG